MARKNTLVLIVRTYFVGGISESWGEDVHRLHTKYSRVEYQVQHDSVRWRAMKIRSLTKFISIDENMDGWSRSRGKN